MFSRSGLLLGAAAMLAACATTPTPQVSEETELSALLDEPALYEANVSDIEGQTKTEIGENLGISTVGGTMKFQYSFLAEGGIWDIYRRTAPPVGSVELGYLLDDELVSAEGLAFKDDVLTALGDAFPVPRAEPLEKRLPFATSSFADAALESIEDGRYAPEAVLSVIEAVEDDTVEDADDLNEDRPANGNIATLETDATPLLNALMGTANSEEQRQLQVMAALPDIEMGKPLPNALLDLVLIQKASVSGVRPFARAYVDVEGISMLYVFEMPTGQLLHVGVEDELVNWIVAEGGEDAFRDAMCAAFEGIADCESSTDAFVY